MTIHKRPLWDFLICPSCDGEVERHEEVVLCKNIECKLAFPIRNGIPAMISSEAKRFS